MCVEKREKRAEKRRRCEERGMCTGLRCKECLGWVCAECGGAPHTANGLWECGCERPRLHAGSIDIQPRRLVRPAPVSEARNDMEKELDRFAQAALAHDTGLGWERDITELEDAGEWVPVQ